MADLNNLTGWREEKRELENSELWNNTFVNNPECGVENGLQKECKQKTPVSKLLKFLQTMITDPELKAALDAQYVWQHTPLGPDEEIDVDNDPRIPHEANALLADFTDWYHMKSDLCPNAAQTITWLLPLYDRLKDKGIDDIFSEDARELMAHRDDIDFTS